MARWTAADADPRLAWLLMNSQITPATFAPGPNAAGGAPADAIVEAMAGLSGLDSTPTRSHVTAFERVHAALTGALAAIDGV